ncbi:MAG: VanZ family protein [Acidobacteriota bacterium]|nr:VanZ family protein [Acidobacteriota bacterium]
MLRFAQAILFSLAVVAVAPFVGELRDHLKESLEGSFVRVMGMAFVVPLVVVVALVVRRIRTDRVRRYALLLLGLGLMAGQLFGWNRPEAEVNAVERIHFVFYGAITFLFFRAYRRRRDLSALVETWIAAAVVAIADEAVQWLSEIRTGEIIDVGINLYAALCMLLVCLAWDGPDKLECKLPSTAIPSIARHLALATLATAGFIHMAHLGYENHDPEVGTFRSYFTLAELNALNAARTRQWAANPPGFEREPLNIEDYYRSEAGWHLRLRNRSLAAQDFFVAAKENDILEKYYTPFLHLLRNEAGKPFALNPDEQERTEANRPTQDLYPYLSPVFRDPLRIWTTPTKPQLWGLTTVLLAILVFLTLRFPSHRP